ncbi:MAG: hypothetical protein AAGI92_02335 [Pseudomonadota bacterium]
MTRWINAIAIIMVFAAAGWTYSIKHEAENNLASIKLLERQIEVQHELIDFQNADWAVLSSPKRIEELATRFQRSLSLDVTAGHQLATLDDLPGMVDRGASDIIEELIGDASTDEIVTSSVSEAQ